MKPNAYQRRTVVHKNIVERQRGNADAHGSRAAKLKLRAATAVQILQSKKRG